jgi:predicted transcriptional regulator
VGVHHVLVEGDKGEVSGSVIAMDVVSQLDHVIESALRQPDISVAMPADVHKAS